MLLFLFWEEHIAEMQILNIVNVTYVTTKAWIASAAVTSIL